MVSCGITVGAGATGLVGLLTCAGTARKQTRPAPGSLPRADPPGSTEWRGPPSRSQNRGEVRPHFRPPAASCTPRSCRGWYQADRHPGAWQCTGRCLSAPRLGAHKATRGPSWGGSWRSAGLSSASASSASRACAACLKNRASNSPTASETLSHAARPIGTHHHALMCRPPAGGTSHVRTLTVRLCPLHDGPAGPSRPKGRPRGLTSPARALADTRTTGSPAPGSAPQGDPARAPARPPPTGSHTASSSRRSAPVPTRARAGSAPGNTTSSDDAPPCHD